jgi:VCBS repeat-containing protein
VFHSTCDARGEGPAFGGSAQLMAAPPPEPIGTIQAAIGSVTVMSASGVVAQVKVGDPVYQHDTIETGADGAVGITFVDGTAFKLSNNARMVLTEFVSGPNGTADSALFSLGQGAFRFVAGKVAKTGGLTIDTPIARIRGTSQGGGSGILTLGALTFSAIEEIQAASRPDAFLDDDAITYKHLPHGTYEIVFRDGRVIQHDDPGETIQVTPDGNVTRIPKTSSQVEQGAALAQQTASLSLGQGAAPGGSSTPTFDIPLQLQPINFSPPANNDAASQPVPVLTPTTSGRPFEPPELKAPPPVLAADAGSRPVFEFPNTTGSSAINVAPAATLSFTDLKLSAVSASLASITWAGGDTLPSGLSTVLASALTTSASADSTGFSGSVAATFSAADDNFDFLAANETLTVVYNVTVTDSNGVSVTQPVTITVTGTNDEPVLAADSSGPHMVTEGLNTTGTLTFTDVDLTDHHTVSTSMTSATWSGGTTLPSGLAAVLAGALSTTTTDSTGSGSGSIAVTLAAADNFDFLAAGQTLTVTYNVTVTDNNGVSSSQPVTFTITGTNDAPVVTVAETASYSENAAPVPLSPGATVSEVDNQTLQSAKVSIGSGFFTGDVLAASVAGTSITASYDAATGVLTLTGNDTLAHYQQVLEGVTYVSTSDNPTNFGADTSRTISWVLNDGTLNSATQTTTLNLTAVDDAPTATAPASYSTTEQTSLSLKGTGLSISDVDAGTGSMTVTLSVGEGTLSATAGNSGAGVSGSGTSTLTITGTVAQVNAFLGATSTSTLSYIDNTDTPSASTTLTLSVNDNGNTGPGGPLTGSASSTINLTAVDDAPTATAPASYSTTEQTSLSLKGTGLSISDVDAGTGSMTVTLSVGEGTLSATAGNSGAGVSGSGTSTLTITGTVAQVNAFLGATSTSTLSYIDNTDTPSASTTLTLSVNDNGNTGPGGPLTGSASSTISITAVDDAPVITSGAPAVAVSEEGLPNGVADAVPAGFDTTNSTTASGTITASDAENDALTMTFGTPGTLTSGGTTIAWTFQDSDHTLIGKAGTTTVVTATITDGGVYNVTLSGPIDHSTANQEDTKTFSIPVNVSDGHTMTSTTLSVTVEDDSPKAGPVEVSVDTTDSKTNVMLILDVSGSMDSPSGLPGLTRLDAAKAAVNELLEQYDSRGDVMVRIVTFSDAGTKVGSVWMNVAEAKAAIAGLSAGGGTNYDAALLTAMTAFTAGTKLSGPGTQNVSYFVSDGEPTTGSDWPQITGTQSIPGIQDNERGVWESFLTTNNIVSFALGISNGAPQTANLNPIAFDPASGTQLADTPIIVTDLDQLADTLVFTIPPVTGTVLTGAGGATSNSFGADGGYVKSITVDGVTYTFNPAANGGAGGITTSGGSFTYNETTKTLTVDTDTSVVGGELAMVMTTGAFTFQRPIDFSSESVGYVLVDGDGDTASSTLHFSAAVLPAGVAGNPINLGLTNPADHTGPVTVTIAGVPSGWTLSEGTPNGDGSWTIQASNVSALSITSPDNYAGARAFQVTMSWTNADDSSGFARVTDNVEVFAQGAPIFAWSGDDHLTGSSGKDLFVFAQPIGYDTIYSFNASEDQIDLIGYACFTNFDDVQRHLVEDKAGNAVIALAGGQSIALFGVAASSLTANNFVFDQTPVLNNPGAITIGDGALLPLSGIINNAGTIALHSAGNETHLQLVQYGMTLQGGGQLILSDSGENFISGTIPSVTLTNADNTISGAGQLGAGQMALVNDGTIIATGSDALIIDTGANVVTNTGTLAATGSGELIVNGDIANSGLIWAHGGQITINGAVTGSGHAMISGAGTLGFGAAFSADVIFAEDAAGRLTLEHAAYFTGTISGFSSDDQIDLANIGYATASLYDVTYNASTDLTTLVITDGTSANTLQFVGNYTVHTAWHFSNDGNGGTLLTDSPADGSGTSSVAAAASADLAPTVAAALTNPDQFTFQDHVESGTAATGSTLLASTDPSAADASDTTQSSPHDTTATTLADANAATNTQPATADATHPDATPQTASAPAASLAAADTFVFAANFGNVTLGNFDPGTDVIEIDHTVFADFQELLAAAHDDGNGNAVIAADSHDTITIKNVTVAQLVQHQGDFHFT